MTEGQQIIKYDGHVVGQFVAGKWQWIPDAVIWTNLYYETIHETTEDLIAAGVMVYPNASQWRRWFTRAYMDIARHQNRPTAQEQMARAQEQMDRPERRNRWPTDEARPVHEEEPEPEAGIEQENEAALHQDGRVRRQRGNIPGVSREPATDQLTAEARDMMPDQDPGDL